jgi:hypothetical protein
MLTRSNRRAIARAFFLDMHSDHTWCSLHVMLLQALLMQERGVTWSACGLGRERFCLGRDEHYTSFTAASMQTHVRALRRRSRE